MLSKWIKIGNFGVDSGQVLITDPCYLSGWKGNEFEDTAIKKMQKDGKFEYSYSGACARTLLKLPDNRCGAGSIGNSLGVVSSTGYGDGEYPVYAKFNDDGRVMQLKIDFT